MNFIIEVIKKSADSHQLVYVVRNQQGFPLVVKDSLSECSDFIQSEVDMALSSSKDKKFD